MNMIFIRALWLLLIPIYTHAASSSASSSAVLPTAATTSAMTALAHSNVSVPLSNVFEPVPLLSLLTEIQKHFIYIQSKIDSYAKEQRESLEKKGVYDAYQKTQEKAWHLMIAMDNVLQNTELVLPNLPVASSPFLDAMRLLTTQDVACFAHNFIAPQAPAAAQAPQLAQLPLAPKVPKEPLKPPTGAGLDPHKGKLLDLRKKHQAKYHPTQSKETS